MSVPATLQATIAARIDRLPTRSKTHVERGGGHRVAVQPRPVDPARRRTRRYRPGGGPVHRSGQIHPPTRVCVPPSADSCGRLRGSAQVGSRRACTGGSPPPSNNATTTSVGENAALIAEHLEAAGDLRSAYAWHMRAGAWSSSRDIRAARISWERARRVADALPANDPERTAMRIAPRTALCTSTWRAGLGVADTGFDELRGLCASAGDDLSLAIGMYGQVVGLGLEHRPPGSICAGFRTVQTA